mmetsp:Transcript_42882/g.111191  ORF Transcript_42882/g.111191 Transcript_42882/m.111191 type:complete len:233 (+) Transcript_42882:3-701(+)
MPSTWGRSKWSAVEHLPIWGPGGPGGGSGKGGNRGGGHSGDDGGSGMPEDKPHEAGILNFLAALVANPAFQCGAKDALLCAATFMTADIMVQTMAGASLIELDIARVMRLAAFGLLIKGPSMSWFYHSIETQLPGKSARRVVEKMLVDQTGWSWVNNLGFLFLMPVMEGRSCKEALHTAKEQFPKLQRNAYMLWPAAHLVNFGFVPPGARTLYISAVSLTWTTMCCLFRDGN